MIGGRGNRLALFAQCGGHSGNAFGHINEQILHGSQIRFLSTDTRLGTACASGSFLTLIAKHLIFHNENPPD